MHHWNKKLRYLEVLVEIYRTIINIPGWWFQPLWKIWKSIGMIIPNIWKNKIHVPNHQPDPFTGVPWCTMVLDCSLQQKIHCIVHFSGPIDRIEETFHCQIVEQGAVLPEMGHGNIAWRVSPYPHPIIILVGFIFIWIYMDYMDLYGFIWNYMDQWIMVINPIDRYWLVVDLPLWKIWVRQLGWWNSQYMEIHRHVPNNQPVIPS